MTNSDENRSVVEIDWNNFNSSFLIETFNEEGPTIGLGVAVRKDTILTSIDQFEKAIYKLKVRSLFGINKKSENLEVEGFELHPENDLIKIKLREELPNDIKIYPIIKNKNKFDGKFIRIGCKKVKGQERLTLVSPGMKSIGLGMKYMELIERRIDPMETSGGGIYMISGGQINLIAISSMRGFSKESSSTINPMVLGIHDWIESPVHNGRNRKSKG
jgi:hypothetical protein